MFSHEDTFKLEALRIRRFHSLFGDLFRGCILQFGADDLAIAAPDHQAANLLVSNPNTLPYFSWVVLGIRTITLKVAGEVVWHSCTRNDSALSWEDPEQGSLPMPSATLEAPIAAPAAPTAPVTPENPAPLAFQALRSLSDVIGALSKLTGRPGQELLEEIKSTGVPIFEFGGQLLVDASATDPLIDRWAESLKLRLRDFSLAQNDVISNNGKVTSEAPAPRPKRATAPKVSAAKSSTRKPANKSTKSTSRKAST